MHSSSSIAPHLVISSRIRISTTVCTLLTLTFWLRFFTEYFILHFIVYTFFSLSSISIYGAVWPGYHPTSLLYIFGPPCIHPLFPTFTLNCQHRSHFISLARTISFIGHTFSSTIHPTFLVRTYNQLSSQSSSPFILEGHSIYLHAKPKLVMQRFINVNCGIRLHARNPRDTWSLVSRLLTPRLILLQ